jgi:hypothetical protein
MNRSLLKWELTGIGVIFLMGSGFHFLFDAFGSNPIAGIFFPVNESVFEHLKLTFWPTIIWAAFSYSFLKSTANNFLIAKAAAVIIMPLVIIALFYVYTVVTADNVVADILIFLAAVAAGQFVNYLLLKTHPLPQWLSGLSPIIILALGVLYALFTFYPPYTGLFMDSNTGGYGIMTE